MSKRWRAAFFKGGRNIAQRFELPGSASQLALIRLVFCTHLLTVFTTPAIGMLNLFESRPHPLTATLLPAFLEAWIVQHIVALHTLGAVACLLALLGVATRLSVGLTWLAFFLTQNFYFRATLFHDDWLYFNFYLLILTLSRSGDAWSVDSLLKKWWGGKRGKSPKAPRLHLRYRWPLELMILWYALTYFAAGVAKLFPLRKGYYFLSGQTLQQFVAEFHLDSPIYWWLGHSLFDYMQTWPFALIGILTVLVELAAWLLLWSDRLYWPIALSVCGMHLGILCFGIPGFLQISIVSLVLFLPVSLFRRLDQVS